MVSEKKRLPTILQYLVKHSTTAWADPESFDRGGPTLKTFILFIFLIDEGRKEQYTIIIRSPLAHHRNAI